MASLPVRSCLGVWATLLALFAGSPVARGDETPAGTMAFSVEVPAGKLPVAQLHTAILKAVVERHWNVKEDSTEKIVTFLSHRKNEATVTYVISPDRVIAYCEGYAIDGKGVRQGPEQPTRWLNYLKEDITAGFSDAAARGK